MPRATLILVLLVSCAHALVHMYEKSLPSVEQEIAATYFASDDQVRAKQVSGWMQLGWRLPLGLGALLAGWLVHRYGARRLLAIYLLGCGGMSLLAGLILPLPTLFVVMIMMGVFACIYHPAGLALLSHETDIHNRGRALGIHGVFGSAGIGAAPFLAGFVLMICSWFDVQNGWRVHYLLMAVPGILLGLVFVCLHIIHRQQAPAEGSGTDADDEDSAAWGSFFLLTCIAALMGFIYTAVLTFLPRYLDGHLEQMGVVTDSIIPPEAISKFLTGGVLLLGCVAQYTAGRFARHRLLEIQFCGICFVSAPCLLWMANATGVFCVVAAATFALFHFMHQPIYNSMIAKYTPRHRRSLAYGFSFAMGLGVGSLGAVFAGYNQSNLVIYGTLSAVAATGGTLSFFLWLRHRSDAGKTD